MYDIEQGKLNEMIDMGDNVFDVQGMTKDEECKGAACVADDRQTWTRTTSYPPHQFPLMPTDHPHSVILVTGGTGLVGYAIQHVIETEPVGSRFGPHEGEQWVFIGSKDADLRYVSNSIIRPLQTHLSNLATSAEIWHKPKDSSTNISQRMSFTSPRSVRRLSLWVSYRIV
jgi:hypothetical protein